AYPIRALRDLRRGIKSESLERVKWQNTPFGSSLESPGKSGASFCSRLRDVRRSNNWPLMSASGQERASVAYLAMSALPLKADTSGCVRLVPTLSAHSC